MSPEYAEQLRYLAHLLCPLKEVVEVNPLSIPRDEENEYYPFQIDVEDEATGFDLNGNFHHPRNRWDSMGYMGDV